MVKRSTIVGPLKGVTNNEFIPIAPLHHPKTKVDLKELGKSTEDRELLTMPLPQAPPPPHLVYNNGPLISQAKIYTIFWVKTGSPTPALLSCQKTSTRFSRIF